MTIEDILLNGTKEEKKELWGFDKNDGTELIQKKFHYFVVGNYPRYLEYPDCAAHAEMIYNMIESYRGNINFLNIASRGLAKTTKAKLLVVFLILNDRDSFRKYIKVNTKDSANSVQFVTDLYNLIIEVEDVYGDCFEKEGKIKREERMGSFTMQSSLKVQASTVGKTQRGHVHGNKRPDWIIFDDVEDSMSVESDVQTQSIIKTVDEAIQGMSVDGNYMVNANYISDIGVVENFKKKDVVEMITPIIKPDGTPTWDYFTPEKIKQIKNDAEDWFGDYLCDPVTGAKREFKREYFKYIPYSEVEKMDTRKFLTIDSAVKKEKGSDYTGFTLNFVNRENKWHFKSWREKLDSAELIKKMFELWDYYNLEAIGIEETTFTMAIKPFLEEEMRKCNKFMRVLPLKHGGRNKEARIRGLIPRYESSSVYHIEGECKDLEGELLRFPSNIGSTKAGVHDDTMDSAAYQYQIVIPIKSKTEEKRRSLQLLKTNLRKSGIRV